jgi:predicted N-acyltransferase
MEFICKNIFWVIKYRRMRGVGHAAHMGERRGVYGFWWGNLRERDYLEDTCVRWEDTITMDLKEVGWVGMN